MTTSGGLRQICAAILRGQTDAGDEVYTPSDWATYAGEYPVILVSCPREIKTALEGHGMTEFSVVATIRIVAKVQMAAGNDDIGAMFAEGQLEGLKGQIERLLINNPALICFPDGGRRISQFPSVRAMIGLSAEGEDHLAELMLELDCEFYQGPEDFWDPSGVPLRQVSIGLTEPAGTIEPGVLVTFP